MTDQPRSDEPPLEAAVAPTAPAFPSRPASARPPEPLPGLMSLPEIRPWVVEEVERDAAGPAHERAPLPGPFCPEWLAVRARPARAPRPSGRRPPMMLGAERVTPLHIFPPDDRRAYVDPSYPWGTVCRVITGVGLSSGAIVGPRHVLTASHAIDWGAFGGSVEVHRAGGAFSAITSIERVLSYTRVGAKVPTSEVDEDYAVLITRDRIGELFGWLGVRTYDSSWDGRRFWSTFGYPGDVPGHAPGDFPSFQQAVWLDEDALDLGGGRAMSTDADLAEGHSGGPMFAQWADGPYAVAVVSSQTRSENYCAGGSDLTRLVRTARERHG